MELVNHIRDLLYHHDCVVVPGFGGFVTNQRPARIDPAGNGFFPPARDVGFNARLDHNDGLLISYISAKLSINYIDARKLVSDFVDELTRKLEKDRMVHFEGIGQFTAGRDGTLRFDPDEGVNFLTDAYGLSFFRFPQLEGAGAVSRKSSRKMNRTTGTSRTRKLLRYAAITIPLAAALAWGAMNTNVIREFSFDLSSINPFRAVVDSGIRVTDRTDTAPMPVATEILEVLEEQTSQQRALSYAEPEPQTAEEQVEVPAAHGALPEQPDQAAGQDIAGQELPVAAPASDDRVVAEAPVGDRVLNAEPSAEVVPSSEMADRQQAGSDSGRDVAMATPAEVSPPAAQPEYHIIAGTFRNNANAETLRQELQEIGYRSRVISSGTGTYWVSLHSTPYAGEARQMLVQVRSMAGRNDAWIMNR